MTLCAKLLSVDVSATSVACSRMTFIHHSEQIVTAMGGKLSGPSLQFIGLSCSFTPCKRVIQIVRRVIRLGKRYSNHILPLLNIVFYN